MSVNYLKKFIASLWPSASSNLAYFLKDYLKHHLKINEGLKSCVRINLSNSRV